MRRYLFSINEEMNVYDFDVVIIGSGVGGLYSALHIDSGLQVAVVTKANLDESNSYLAQGGIAAVMSPEDNYINHIEDTLMAGAGLCDPEAVKTLVEEGPENIKTLIDMKVPFDVNPEGDLQITREGGHRMRRIVHCGGDATGKETTIVLGNIALKKENLHFFFETFFVDILTDDDGICGVVVKVGDDYRVLRTRNVIIATGGLGQIYEKTSNPLGAVGDGIAAAYRASAVLEDMEMVQFHPTMLASDGKDSRLFLISEAVRGEGGILRNSRGEAFMAGKHELADLAPRDIVTRCILSDMKKTGDTNVFLDVSSMTTEFFSKRFPTIYEECLSKGIRLTEDLIPVVPAQHYFMGGIKTDRDGRTNIKGLFSCGEAARTGIHGANRLASNSLLECLVFGRRAARYINKNIVTSYTDNKKIILKSDYFDNRLPSEFFVNAEKRVKSLMSEYVGAIRRSDEMQIALEGIDQLLEIADSAELILPYEFKIYNMMQVAKKVVEAALARRECIGAHYIVQ
ncbi:MAG: L-aspartate oxidase [Eubacteriales bacterium]|nr:L-aspartate oxidase [Eubacteriales bacterium]MDD4422579.1 L-aspartate oxidase [Eubacteriales bacterium]